MQYIDNDMDDLFRKAEENYPLRTDGADWEAVQAKMAAEPAAETPRRSNRRYLWLLLLLLIPVSIVIYNNDRFDRTEGRASHQVESSASNHAESANTENHTPSRGILADHLAADSADRTLTPTQRNASAEGKQKETMPNHVHPSSENAAADLSGNNAVSAHTDESTKINQQQDIRQHQHVPTAEIQSVRGKVRSDRPGDPFKSTPNPASDVQEKNAIEGNTNQPRGGNTDEVKSNTPQSAAGSGNNPGADLSAENEIPVDSGSTARQPKPADSVSINKTDTATIAKAQPKKEQAVTHKGFYYGAIAGPDVSTIKSQKVTHIGYTAGALLGYKINGHWSIEAGILWDRKKYYTDGKYFDKARTNIPPSVTVTSMDGSCNMFEFPLAVKYDLQLKKNSVFFTAGLTSYVMKNEAYTYDAEYGSVYYRASRSYKNSGSNLFSNLQLSAGYQYNLSRSFSLRIEPYIKLPVKDIGIGNMPISSKGLYIGIIRNMR